MLNRGTTMGHDNQISLSSQEIDKQLEKSVDCEGL